ncbi:hypothetical protein U9M48_038751, partial [Paspalum notatum var. saurae]
RRRAPVGWPRGAFAGTAPSLCRPPRAAPSRLRAAPTAPQPRPPPRRLLRDCTPPLPASSVAARRCRPCASPSPHRPFLLKRRWCSASPSAPPSWPRLTLTLVASAHHGHDEDDGCGVLALLFAATGLRPHTAEPCHHGHAATPQPPRSVFLALAPLVHHDDTSSLNAMATARVMVRGKAALVRPDWVPDLGAIDVADACSASTLSIVSNAVHVELLAQ